MKKRAILGLILCIVLMLCACKPAQKREFGVADFDAAIEATRQYILSEAAGTDFCSTIETNAFVDKTNPLVVSLIEIAQESEALSEEFAEIIELLELAAYSQIKRAKASSSASIERTLLDYHESTVYLDGNRYVVSQKSNEQGELEYVSSRKTASDLPNIESLGILPTSYDKQSAQITKISETEAQMVCEGSFFAKELMELFGQEIFGEITLQIKDDKIISQSQSATIDISPYVLEIMEESITSPVQLVLLKNLLTSNPVFCFFDAQIEYDYSEQSIKIPDLPDGIEWE